MVFLGTPTIRLFSDSETALLFGCIVLGYTALYFYLLTRELKKILKQLQLEDEDHSETFSVET